MRSLVVLSFAALASCASANNSPVPAPERQESVRISNTGGAAADLRITPESDTPLMTTVGAPVDAVWNALAVVYDSLAIPLTTRDAVTHTLGNTSLKTRRRLGSARLGQYLDCGSSQGVPSVDNYELLISVVTSAQATAEGTMIGTQVSAQGRPVAFSGEYIRCSSTGALEKQIANRVRLLVK